VKKEVKRSFYLVCLLLFSILIASGTAMAATDTETVLHRFSGPDGAYPSAEVIMDSAGNLYGTTTSGGAYGYGTVFRLDTSGNLTTLHSFSGPDGQDPYAGLIMDIKGNLYGTTSYGGAYGAGTIYKLDISGNFTTLHNFNGSDGSDGAYPFAGLIMDSTGNLYGTTYFGGANDLGTVFKLDTNGTLTLLHSFSGPDGYVPHAELIMDSAGNLYGTTMSAGAYGYGTVFRLDASSNLTTLHSFAYSDGIYTRARLLMDSMGNLYGTTWYGGAHGAGTIYKLDTSGNLTVLHNFSGYPTDGTEPYAGLIMDTTGNLYGTTSHSGALAPYPYGTVFKLDTSGNLTTLYSFSGWDGAFPFARLLMDSAGNLYGTTAGISGSGNGGTVFKLTQPDTTPPVTTASLSPSPNGAGWNNTNVTVTLTSTDNEANGTGVKSITYTLSGAQSGGGTITGSTGSFMISTPGVTTVNYYAQDNAGNVETTKTIIVTICQLTLSPVTANPSLLWPPNGKMVEITLGYTVKDVCQATCQISSVTSNEPISSSDYSVIDDHHLGLSSERLGTGNGRIYTVTATCTDGSGASASQSANVVVPHDQGH
jgi:uncharacterized repeat protein (TIGR03803 family)